MLSRKKILDKIKEDVFYYAFKNNRFDLKEMKEVNKAYDIAWRKITTQVIVWTAIVSTNLMSLIYIRTFINISWTWSIVAGVFLSYIMKKSFDKIIKTTTKD